MTEQVDEMVHHPRHYSYHPSGVECIEITENLPFSLGNAVKYLWRKDHKASAKQDLEKAAWYLARERDRVARLGVPASYDYTDAIQRFMQHELYAANPTGTDHSVILRLLRELTSGLTADGTKFVVTYYTLDRAHGIVMSEVYR